MIRSKPRRTTPQPNILTSPRRRVQVRSRVVSRSRLFGPVGPQRYYLDGRGLYRVFNAAEYQFFSRVNATFRDDVNGPVPDTYLDAGNTAVNYGSFNRLEIGWTAAALARRAILKFDLSVLPAGSVVTRARLLLKGSAAASSSGTPAKVRRLTQSAWVESTATWANYDTALPWGVAGGDFSIIDQVDWTLPIVVGDFEISGLKVLAQDAIDNRSGLLHVILMRAAESGNDSLIFVRSGEYATAAERPRLLVECDLPAESDTAFASNATLPHEPAATHIDGAWYFGAQWFDGVLLSGLRPLGVAAERFARVDVSGGSAVARPPQPPNDWQLVKSAPGVVQVRARYWQSDGNRATQWALTYTTDGSEPTEGPHAAPTATQTINARGVDLLEFDLPAQADGTTVKVRLQTRRQVTSVWYYSEGSTVKTITADAAGGNAPTGAQAVPKS